MDSSKRGVSFPQKMKLADGEAELMEACIHAVETTTFFRCSEFESKVLEEHWEIVQEAFDALYKFRERK